MPSNRIKCNRCGTEVYPDHIGVDRFFPCPSCQSSLAVEMYPAILKTISAGIAPQATILTGESSCFYHAEKKASVVCDGCGRFLCALCDLEINNRHLCPVCLETGQKKSKFKDLENKRVRWDRIALTMALLPVLCVWPSLVFAPATLYVVIRYRKAPCSLTGRSNGMFIAAAVLAVLQIVGWVVFFTYLYTRRG